MTGTAGPLMAVTAGDAVAAIAVGLLVFFACSLGLVARDIRRVRRRVEAHVRVDRTRAQKPRESGRAALAALYTTSERMLDKLRAGGRLASLAERAGVETRPGQLFVVMLASGLFPALLFAAVGVPPVAAFFLFLLASSVPCLVLGVKAARRQRAFNDQLPHLLMAMSASIRVGHSFRQAMQVVASEGHEPARKEFERVLVETDLGRPLDGALTEMAQRVGSRDLDYVIQAVAIQREVGGSLAGLFDMVAETVRQRQQFAKRVRGLTAQARLSAYIVAAMPFVALAFMTAINPKYTTPLFKTSTGHVLLGIALTGILIGGVVLKKMASFRLS